MTPKKPVPDAIGDGYRFSEKVMLQAKAARVENRRMIV
jgi:hypothetical protein